MPPTFPPIIGANPANLYDLDCFINCGKYGWQEGYWLYLTGSSNPFADIRSVLDGFAAARQSFMSSEAVIYGFRAQQAGQILPIQLSQIWLWNLFGGGKGALLDPASLPKIGWWIEQKDPTLSVGRTTIFHGFPKSQENWNVNGQYTPKPEIAIGLQLLFTYLGRVFACPNGGTLQFCLKSSDWQPIFAPPVYVLSIATVGTPSTLQFTVPSALEKGPLGARKDVELNDYVLLNQTNRGSTKGIYGPHRITGIVDTVDSIVYTTATKICCKPLFCACFVGTARVLQYAYYPFGPYQPQFIRKRNLAGPNGLMTWVPTDEETMTAHPCALGVDIGRIGYHARMQFPGVTPICPVVWFGIRDQTKLVPMPTAFGTRRYSTPHGWDGIGEQYDYSCCGADYRPKYFGGPPAPYAPGPGCGSAGAFAGNDAPTFVTNIIGMAPCCANYAQGPVTGGQQEGGSVFISTGATAAVTGGGEEGGSVAVSVSRTVPVSGGQQEGGNIPASSGVTLPVTGGQQEGGSVAISTGVTAAVTGGGQEGGSVAVSTSVTIPVSGGGQEGGHIPSGEGPATPTGLSLTVGNAQLGASWTAPGGSPGASTYNVQYSTSPSFTSPTTVSGIATTSYTITGLTNGTTYYVRVQGVTAGGFIGPFTAGVSGTPTSSSPFTSGTTALSTITLARPSTYAPGDGILIAGAGIGSSSSGYSMTATGTVAVTRNGPNGGLGVEILGGANATEPATLTINVHLPPAGVFWYDLPAPLLAPGSWTVNPIVFSFPTGTTAHGAAFTPLVTGKLFVLWAWNPNSATLTPPSPFTQVGTTLHLSATQSVALFEYTVNPVGTVPAGTWTWSAPYGAIEQVSVFVKD